jgi:hypothetical protein
VTSSPKPWACPRWTTPNGACSDDDSGAGLHTCRSTSSTHAKCRCACGVETLRPIGDREVAKYEERLRQVSINVGPGGEGKVVVGGVDIASLVTSATVELRGMQPTSVTLGMEAVRVVAEAEGELDDVTAGALVGLGWTSPEGDLLRRRDLQEALGGLDSVLRDWDSLLVFVRKLAEVNTGLTENEQRRLDTLRKILRRDDADWGDVLTLVSTLRDDMDVEQSR